MTEQTDTHALQPGPAGEGRPELAMVVAASTNNVIGKNNHLVWHLPNDLRFFKNTTWGFPVIMGRKTFEEVNKPLPGRINIVITRNKDWHAEDTVVAPDLPAAIAQAAATNAKQAIIIGGAKSTGSRWMWRTKSILRGCMPSWRETLSSRQLTSSTGNWYPTKILKKTTSTISHTRSSYGEENSLHQSSQIRFIVKFV